MAFAKLVDLYVKTWPVDVLPVRLYQLGVVPEIVNKLKRKQLAVSTAHNRTVPTIFHLTTANSFKAARKTAPILLPPPPKPRPVPAPALPVVLPVIEPKKPRKYNQGPKKPQIISERPPETPEQEWERYYLFATRHGAPRKPGWASQTLPSSEIALPVISDVLRDLTSPRRKWHRAAEDLNRVLIEEGATEKRAKKSLFLPKIFPTAFITSLNVTPLTSLKTWTSVWRPPPSETWRKISKSRLRESPKSNLSLTNSPDSLNLSALNLSACLCRS